MSHYKLSISNRFPENIIFFLNALLIRQTTNTDNYAIYLSSDKFINELVSLAQKLPPYSINIRLYSINIIYI